jgi:RNA polymerase sigma-70 factor (ECF subfamily)
LKNDPLEELTAIVNTERRALVGVARAEGATPEEALECVQDALCTFLVQEREGSLVATGPEHLASLYTMVRNAARNQRRRHHRLKPHEPIAAENEPPAELPSPEELLVYAEDTVRLRACVSELCGVQRAVVTLRLLDERSGDDVAELLGVSRGHVDVLVHRAKAALRVCMREPGAHRRPGRG